MSIMLPKQIPPPRTKKKNNSSSKNQEKPISALRTKINKVNKALNDTTKSFEVQIVNASDPLIQLKRTQNVISHKELQETKGFKFNHTLEVPFTKISDGEIIYKTAFINSKSN